MLAIKLRRLPFHDRLKRPITENSPLTRGNCSPNSRARNDAVICRGERIYSLRIDVSKIRSNSGELAGGGGGKIFALPRFLTEFEEGGSRGLAFELKSISLSTG